MMGWFSKDNEEEDDDTDIEDWVEEVTETLKDNIESGEGTSWFDKLFGEEEDDDK